MLGENLRTLSIGLFDSGVGGLTVLREVAAALPNEQLIYFGDTARMPYGDKSSAQVKRFAIENTEFLQQVHPLKLLIVACNTAASACSPEELEQHCSFPVVDVIRAGVESVIQTTKSKRIAVIGTRGTIRTGIYEREILDRLPDAEVTSIACPLLALLVEEHFTDHEASRLIIKEYLAPLKSKNIDTLLLGCTHYPLIKHLIAEYLGENVAIVDSAYSCAQQVKRLLEANKLCNRESARTKDNKFYVSDDPERFSIAARIFLGYSPQAVLTSSEETAPALCFAY